MSVTRPAKLAFTKITSPILILENHLVRPIGSHHFIFQSMAESLVEVKPLDVHKFLKRFHSAREEFQKSVLPRLMEAKGAEDLEEQYSSTSWRKAMMDFLLKGFRFEIDRNPILKNGLERMAVEPVISIEELMFQERVFVLEILLVAPDLNSEIKWDPKLYLFDRLKMLIAQKGDPLKVYLIERLGDQEYECRLSWRARINLICYAAQRTEQIYLSQRGQSVDVGALALRKMEEIPNFAEIFKF